jgi:hypothetical protein
MAWLDAFLEGVQSVLSDIGADVELPVLRSLFWLVVAAVGSYWAYKAIKALVKAGVATGGFVKAQIEGKFWQDPGKLRLVIGVLLFVVAYGFYGQAQSRPLGEALADIVRGQVLAVMPLAIMTQWLLLIVFWLLLGLVLGVPVGKLLKPIGDITIGIVLITAEVLMFTFSVLAFGTGDPAVGGAWLAGLTAVNLVLAWMGVASERRRLGRRPDGWRGSVVLLGLVLTFLLLVLFCMIGGIIAWVRGMMGADLTDPAGAIRVALIAMLVVFLLSCFMFRSGYLNEAGAPEALFYFIDFSLALAAGVVALLSVQQSPVTLGPVPAWVVAAGPPLIVAGMLFFVRLRGLRGETPRWTAALLVAAGAAFLVLPATLLLTKILAPLLPQPDLPFL